MRYPFAPIEPLLAHMTAAEIADIIGVKPGTVRVCRARGSSLSEQSADLLATALHIHPAEIWPDWQADLFQPCAACSTPFVPNKPWQRFCSTPCRWATRDKARRAETERERYWRDEQKRERKRAAAAEYTAEVGRIKRRRAA